QHQVRQSPDDPTPPLLTFKESVSGMLHLGANQPAPPSHWELHHTVQGAGLIAIDDPGGKHAGQSPRMPRRCSAMFEARPERDHFRMRCTLRIGEYLETI